MSMLQQESLVLSKFPTIQEENWRRIDAQQFFLPDNDILNINGQNAMEEKGKLLPWKVNHKYTNTTETIKKAWENIGGTEFTELLIANEHRLIWIDIQAGYVDVFSPENLKSFLQLKSAPWEARSLVHESKVGLALSQRLKFSSPHQLEILLSGSPQEIPLLVVTNHYGIQGSQSYAPVHLIFTQDTKCDLLVLDQGAEFSLTRYLWELEENSQVQVLWSCLPSQESKHQYIEREVILHKNAILREAQVFVPQGKLRINSHISLKGHSSISKSSSAVIASKGIFDYEPVQEHIGNQSQSRLALKMIVSKKAKCSFHGLIEASQSAQKCLAIQDNKNLLLSSLARIDAQPRLHILPHEISCKHGSATGEIDAKQLYYLQCRGFSLSQARQLIIEGFALSALENLPSDHILSLLGELFIKKVLEHDSL